MGQFDSLDDQATGFRKLEDFSHRCAVYSTIRKKQSMSNTQEIPMEKDSEIPPPPSPKKKAKHNEENIFSGPFSVKGVCGKMGWTEPWARAGEKRPECYRRLVWHQFSKLSDKV